MRHPIVTIGALGAIQSTRASNARYVWEFVGGKPVQNRWRTLAEIPAETETSRAMSKALRRRGLRFVGPTICYSLMQAWGWRTTIWLIVIDIFRLRSPLVRGTSKLDTHRSAETG